MWTKQILVGLLLVGVVSCFPQTRIVNGSDTTIETYPWMVSLRNLTGFFGCGASIIASNWILTAAHCVADRSPSQFTIQYGVTVISSSGPNIIGAKRIIVHENYIPMYPFPNDIALIELTSQLVFDGKTIDAVQLPNAYFEIDQVPDGVPGILVGWGRNETNGSIQSTLQAVDLKIYSDAECKKRHNGDTNGDHICGGVDNGGDQCRGDSGGPLMLKNKQQVGIVSWSARECALAPNPGVYTKVSHYINWINKNIS